MNELIASLILAIVQGITEWLPISSSGHLIIFERLLGYDASLMFEIALHFGTLMAVFVYFGKDIVDIVRDFLRGAWKTENGRTAWMLIVASIPAGLIGFLFYDFLEQAFNNLTMVALGFAITAVFLFIASMDLGTKKHQVGFGEAFIMGCAQALAILPGISRSGATISSGLLFGLSEKAAMRFSFLMVIPVILGASLLSLGTQPIPSMMILPAIVAFLSGLATMHILFKYALKSKKNLRWFALYAFVLALGLGVWILLN